MEQITGRQPPSGAAPECTVADVRFDNCYDALGIGVAQPRLTWRVSATTKGWHQGAYAVEAYGPDGRLLEEAGRVESGESVLVPWPFTALSSRERRLARVMVWDTRGQPSSWSTPTPVEAGLLDGGDWTARFITPYWEEDVAEGQPCPLLRHSFTARSRIQRARLYVTALGVYEAYINGRVVGDQVLAPGWTSYDHRLRYQTYDVTEMIRDGSNAIGAMLGNGWYRGRLGFGGGRRNIYGDRLALLAQLEIHYKDGTHQLVVTDDAWRATTGPILATELYDGETYDARLERPGWSLPGYDDREWFGVRLLDRDLGTLVAPSGPPVRRTELLASISIERSPAGHTIVDFGQNLVGRLRLTVSGPAGQTITLRHAEVLEQGELCMRPLRTALATDHYTLRGDAPETWEPRFTFHGFRYAQVDGWPGALEAEAIRAVVCHSDLERTGWFECSDNELNRLHENVVWSMRGNFLDIPTDCPQRDERLGWTGDIQVFAPTAAFLYDVSGFLTSWLEDLAAEQDESGAVPFVVPNVATRSVIPAAAWGDAAVIVPWILFQRYADAGILARQFESMRAWVDCLARLAGEKRLWDRGFQFGDWLDPSAPPDRPGAARTNPYLIATAYFARSAELVGLAAGILNRQTEELRYAALAAQVREAFAREYVTAAGLLTSDATTAYALGLQFDLLPDAEQRRHAGERLTALVRESGYRLGTGFVGTPLVCDALCSAGAYDAAFRLLMQRACPSWLYPVTMGATTIWERWDSLLPDGSVNQGEMTSFNHYALGAIADWLHRTVAGLAPAAPGYRRLEIRPRPGGGLTSARARHRTPYGDAEAAWEINSGQIIVSVTIPPSVTASVTLPLSDAPPIEVESGTHGWSYHPVRAAGRPPLTLDSTLGALMEDGETWNALLRAAPQLAGQEARLLGLQDLPLREVAAWLPRGEAIASIVESVLRSIGS